MKIYQAGRGKVQAGVCRMAGHFRYGHSENFAMIAKFFAVIAKFSLWLNFLYDSEISLS